MIKRFFELQERVLSYHKKANTELLKKAYSVAADAHTNQLRATKESYIIHPLSVAGILADMKLDEISISAGLLHDVVEDSSYTIENIESMFGREIRDIVWGVTKISKISDIDPENAKAETLKKMILAMTNDVRVILIKLADRLHNIRTLDALNENKRQRIATETLEIFAPIAERLGMGKMRDTLEDRSFKYSLPEEYMKIHREVGVRKEWAEEKLKKFKRDLQKILRELKIKGGVDYRLKREISIYRKLKKKDINLHKLYDLLGLRIITNSIEDCYAVMGEIHQRFRPIPGRWRDFIANPKNNGYRSIHTTVIAGGVMYEIQIRTKDMHKIAEEGIAAHWKYKEGISFIEDDQRLEWFREMIEAHKNNPDPEEFLNLVKGDLTHKEIYVFTPKGKVINLKAGSSSIDFAYAIHTEVGNHCRQAIVNEMNTSIKKPLNSGDVIEILTSKIVAPSADWLKYVKTSRARKKILNFIQQKENQNYIERGKRMWSRVVREYKKKYSIESSHREINKRIEKLNYTDQETFYRDIGSLKKQLNKKNLEVLFPEGKALEIKDNTGKAAKKRSRNFKLIKLEGVSNVDFTFAKCCNPIKGEAIKGYITLNRGLVIHRANCISLKNAFSERLKNVEWNEDEEFIQKVKFELLVEDRPGILSTVSNITAKYKSNIKKIFNENISQSSSKIIIIFEVNHTRQLKKIVKDFTNTKGVYHVFRKRLSEK